MPKTEPAKNVVFFIILLLIVFAFFEIFFRVFHFESDQFHIPDAKIGISHIPNAEGWYVAGGRATFHKVNSEGFVDKEHNITKPSNVYRMAVLGDSFTEALQVNPDDTFERILEKKLNEINKTRKFEVLNFGVSDMGTAQEYFVFKYHVMKYKPDIVILMFFTPNDISNNYLKLDKNPHKPFFGFSSEGSLVEIPFEPSKKSMISGIASNSKFAVFLYNRIKTAYRNAFVEGAIPAPEVVNSLYFQNSTADWETAWNLTEAILKKMKTDVKSSGSDFLVVIIPHPIQVNKEFDVGIKDPNFNLSYPESRLKKILQKNKINSLFVTDQFIKNASSGNLLYIIGDGHFNEAGHQLMAEEMFKYFVSNVMV